LELINSNPRNGVRALLESCGYLKKQLTVSAIVFTIAPRLNAVGRISSAKKAVHLLTTESLHQGRTISRILENENETRKNIDEEAFKEAIDLVEESIDTTKNHILVLAKEDWHLGVIGIVASRLMEKYNRPCVLISIQNGIGKGSARSTSSFDIYNAFTLLSDHLESFGGHRFAAGLSIKPENIKPFAEKLNEMATEQLEMEQMVPKLEIDSHIDLDMINASFLGWLKRMAPFGPGNLKPVFITENLQTYGTVSKVGTNHLKLKVKQDSFVVDAIGYNLGDFLPELQGQEVRFNCVYVVEENKWSGQTTVQLRIKDFEVL
jgi:single-stranded-DNA-specific exonuclease